MLSSCSILFDQLPDPVLIVDEHMILRAANASAGRFFGYAGDDLPGMKLAHLIPSPVGRIRPGEPREAEAIRSDGQSVYVDLHCGSFEPGGWTIVIVHDVRKWKSMEHNLHLQRVAANVSRMATNEFFVRITHSLKTPLHAIIGFSDILEDEVAGLSDERHKRFAHHIRDNGRRLQRLIEDLLDLSRAESGRFAPRTNVVHLDELVNRMVSLVADLAQVRHIDVSVVAEGNVPSIAADESRLKTAIYNILDSALRSAADDSRVHVRFGRRSATDVFVRFEVSAVHGRAQPYAVDDETHCDAPPYAEPFHRSSLGLPLAARFIEIHGGQLTVSHDDRMGSMCIQVTLPTTHNAKAHLL